MIPATFVVFILLATLIILLVTVYRYSRRRLGVELAAQSHIAHTAAGPVEYVDMGSGPVVMHAHGMLGGVDHLRYNEFLAAHGYRLIVPSRPGYLQTPMGVGRTPLEQAAVYAALLDTLGIQQVVLHAISQGGASSLEFAQAFPERCCGLILVSAFTRPYQSHEISKILPYMRAFMSLDFVLWLLKPLMLPVIMKQARDTLSEADQQDKKKMTALQDFFSSAFQAGLRGSGLINDFSNLLAWKGVPLNRLCTPALIIHGTKDVFVNFGDAEATVKEMHTAKLLLLPGAGHEAFITCVEQIEPEMITFLQANLPCSSNSG